jgi:hypothetical protein
MIRRYAAPLLALLLVSCGYNAAYTAQRRVGDAERAAAAGDPDAAAAAWRAALEAAAAAYRAEPASSRASAALLIVARARLALGDDHEAAGAARYALRHGVRGADRARTHAVLGTALLRSDSPGVALAHFDSAVAAGNLPRPEAAAAHLQRGMAYLSLGRYPDAFADFDVAAQQPAWRASAARRLAEAAVAAGDLPRFQAAFDMLAESGVAPTTATALEDLASASTAQWGPAALASVAATLLPAALEDDVAYRIRLMHAYHASRSALDAMDSPDGLAEVENLLEPVISDSGARSLLRAARGVRRLVQQAGPADPLPLFAAAELARDELTAEPLARALFLGFVRIASETPWAGKALLAAHALRASRETAALLEDHRDNVYVRAASGRGGDAELALAEERLARGLLGLRDAALADRSGGSR